MSSLLRFAISLSNLCDQICATTKSFAVRASGGGGGAEATETAVVEKPRLRRFEVLVGSPMPFGATVMDGGVNFAIHSSGAVSATLCLMSVSDLEELERTEPDWKQNRVTEQINFDPLINKTGDIWHAFLKGDFVDMLYGYKFDGKFSPGEGHYYDSSRILLDPYAKAVISREQYGTLGPDGNCWPQMAGMVPSADNAFDWEGDLPLSNSQRDLIIYEMHVRGFTKHESSNTSYPGTYRGVVEKLDHLKELGINCIELMPCQEYNELEYFSYNSVLGDYRMNFWGYSTLNYFSPMLRYSYAGTRNCGRDAINEVKFLVIMDVVFNHTAEGNEKGPTISFRGVDNSVYYMLAPKPLGCCQCVRGCDRRRYPNDRHPLSSPPLIDMISNDPILRGVKLIAEAWDAGGLYQVGSFPHWGIWSEWNGKYRDIVRQFIKGTDGFSGAFAECLCGSPNLYQQGGRKPWNSINFVCAHDGFTLADLVTYNKKHNLANGEDNMDGESHNNSWNCGQSLVLFSCKIYYDHFAGRRICKSSGEAIKEKANAELFPLPHGLSSLDDFPTADRLQWHGHAPGTPDWSETSRFVAFSLIDSAKREIYIAFNTSHLPVTVALPERPGFRWEPLVDSSKPTPYDFLSSDVPERDTAIKQYAHFLDANLQLPVAVPPNTAPASAGIFAMEESMVMRLRAIFLDVNRLFDARAVAVFSSSRFKYFNFDACAGNIWN
ncbi:hypothetical protein Sjap_023058 [Stephania japonica]|uniref:Glycosyl hydrolase family 13 catalytic domain-containing protein n=1 Tax=Stephania japonica TaxID=461633 RepID=A0AAP0HUZ7_9MAGN